MKIEIIITNDAGESSVIASNNSLGTAGGGRIYSMNTAGHQDARRAMTACEQMATSHMCLAAAAHMFALDPGNKPVLAAVLAYHEADRTTTPDAAAADRPVAADDAQPTA
jgi:hypothetical protein